MRQVLYSASPFLDFVLNALQQSFLLTFKLSFNLVLNTIKTKIMWFGKKNASLPTGVISTSEGLELEVVTSEVLGSMNRRYTVLLSAHIKDAG